MRRIALALLVLAFAAAPAAGKIIVSEVSADQEFVELVNVGLTQAAADTHTVRFLGGGCTMLVSPVQLPSVLLAPGQRFLVRRGAGQPAGDLTIESETDHVPAGGGAVHVVDEDTAIVQDKVAWGDQSGCGEGLPLFGFGAAMGPGESLMRLLGITDTDINAVDLQITNPTQPQNMAMTAPVVTPTPEPTVEPTVEPTIVPTVIPTVVPSVVATVVPSVVPTVLPGVLGITGVALDAPPQVGRPSTLRLTVHGGGKPVTGTLVRFGEKNGLIGASSCRTGGFPASLTQGAEIEVPHTFTTPGAHTVTVTAFTGSCDDPGESTTSTLTVDVAPSGRRLMGTTAAAAQTCAGVNTPLTRRNRAKIAKALLCAINAERAKQGLKKLKASRKLAKIALAHGNDMVGKRFFSHDSPSKGGFVQRVRRARYRGDAGENLGIGAPTVAMIVRAWLGSPTHKANILHKRWKTLGIGLIAANPTTPKTPGATWVNVFGSR
jgi:uncharacterized protein YkwD